MSTDNLDSVYIVWDESEPSGAARVLFKRNAISFDPSINLGISPISGFPAVAASEITYMMYGLIIV